MLIFTSVCCIPSFHLIMRTSQQQLEFFLLTIVPRPVLGSTKRPGRETDHSPLSSAEIKNVWSYTSTTAVVLHSVVLSSAQWQLYLYLYRIYPHRFLELSSHFTTEELMPELPHLRIQTMTQKQVQKKSNYNPTLTSTYTLKTTSKSTLQLKDDAVTRNLRT
jgi:hypothetical protein